MLSISALISHVSGIGVAFSGFDRVQTLYPSSVSGCFCRVSSPQLYHGPETVTPSLFPGPLGWCFPTGDPKIPPTFNGLQPTSLGSPLVPWSLA